MKTTPNDAPDTGTIQSVLEHIEQAVRAHHMPDLSRLKAELKRRIRAREEKLNSLLLEQKQLITQGENAAQRMIQRHQFSEAQNIAPLTEHNQPLNFLPNHQE